MADGMPPLIPREVLVGNPKRWQPTISPDGTRLAYLAPDERDALQIWVRTLGRDDDRCVSAERRSIPIYEWAWDSNTILYRRDHDGDENLHLCAIDLESGNARDLTPWLGVRCGETMTAAKRPVEILAELNVRDRRMMDVWRIDLQTGAATLEVENPGDVGWWVADDELVVRCSFGWPPQGGSEIRVRSDARAPWRTLLKTSPDEEAWPLDFSKDGRELFLKSSIGRDTICVVAMDIESGREREIAAMDGFDAEKVLIHPIRREVDAVAFAPARRKWVVSNIALRADFEALARVDDGDLDVVSRDLTDSKWIVAFTSDPSATISGIANRNPRSFSSAICRNWRRTSSLRCDRSNTGRATGSRATAT